MLSDVRFTGHDFLQVVSYFEALESKWGGGGGGGRGGQGVNLTSYLDSSHKVSQYLSIHSKTLKE